MMTPEIRAEMRRLVLLHFWKIETVARRFGVHHSTVNRALHDAEIGSLAPIPRSVVDDFKPRIIQRITEARELSAVRLLEELRQHGYKHGIAVLRRYVAQVRQPRARKVYLRVEMEPGEQAPLRGVSCLASGRLAVWLATRVLDGWHVPWPDLVDDPQGCQVHLSGVFAGADRRGRDSLEPISPGPDFR